MKSIKLFFTVLLGFCFTMVYAESSYKNVTIDRDKYDNTCFTAQNFNSYPVKIQVEYKIGSRDAEWRDYQGGAYIDIPANKTLKFPVGSKIFALKLTYVDILKPTVGEVIDAVLFGTDGNNSQNSNK